MDGNTASVVAFGIFFGLPVICIFAFNIVRLVLEHKGRADE